MAPRSAAVWALVLVAAFTPGLAVFAPKAVAPLSIVAALAGLTLFWHDRRSVNLAPPGWVMMLVYVVIWGAIASAVGVTGLDGVEKAGSLAVSVLIAVSVMAVPHRLDDVESVRVSRALLVGFIVGAGLFLVEIATDVRINRFVNPPSPGFYVNADKAPYFSAYTNNGAVVLLLLFWPAVLTAYRHRLRVLAVLAVAGQVGVVLMTYSLAVQVSFLVSCAVSGLVLWRRRFVLTALAVGISSAILLSPIFPRTILLPEKLMKTSLPYSALHRPVIWHFTAVRIAERPLVGWGLTAARVISPRESARDIFYDRGEGSTPWHMITEPIPLHPHNAPLQWWLEMGVVGALLGTAFLGMVVYSLARGRMFGTAAALGAGALMSALLVGSFSYGAWQQWWLGTLILTAGFVSLAGRGTQRR